ncbi:MAG: FAD-dependent oxidoreductase [Alphaproteobacteria bacterium]|nr:MAG: FAD-dependent oxidoreductase [Alphaproteobacteria bacterium]TMK05648.1 MAG: FAD-dependent oxidoreductase [Alphaproteobacteria bacterium]
MSHGTATVEVDVLVVGAGAAGMTAALVSSLEGLDVLLCEKSDRVGGTSATSAGTVWVPGTRQSRKAGFTDNVADAKRYLEAVIAAPDKRRDTYLETGPQVVDYLDQRSEVKFTAYTRHPDYLANRPGATIGGRALAALPFDGRLLGADFELVRPPIGEFMALGGMMIGRDDIEPLARPFASLMAFRSAMSLLWRHMTDRLRYRRGTRLSMGNALVARLFYSLRRNGVPIWLNASLQELTVTSGRVCGAVLLVKGNPRRITVRRGIVLATGGFGGSIDRLNEHVRPRLAHAVAFAGAAGDGIRIARAVGASVEEDHASPAFWTPVSETGWLDGGCGAFPHLSLDRAKPGLVAVNAAGRRFVDEAVSYHEFVIGMYGSHRTVPTIPAWLVCDREFIEKYGLGRVPPGRRWRRQFIKSGYLVEATSIGALARKIGVDAAGLRETVQQHNRFAETGEDQEFGKGSTEFDRHNGDPNHAPNPCLGRIGAPPYYAMAVYPSTLGTSVGLRADPAGRVLTETGEPIPGLFVCGNDMASIMRGRYPGPGINLGPALVFAYRAAMAIRADEGAQ